MALKKPTEETSDPSQAPLKRLQDLLASPHLKTLFILTGLSFFLALTTLTGYYLQTNELLPSPSLPKIPKIALGENTPTPTPANQINKFAPPTPFKDHVAEKTQNYLINHELVTKHEDLVETLKDQELLAITKTPTKDAEFILISTHDKTDENGSRMLSDISYHTYITTPNYWTDINEHAGNDLKLNSFNLHNNEAQTIVSFQFYKDGDTFLSLYDLKNNQFIPLTTSQIPAEFIENNLLITDMLISSEESDTLNAYLKTSEELYHHYKAVIDPFSGTVAQFIDLTQVPSDTASWSQKTLENEKLSLKTPPQFTLTNINNVPQLIWEGDMFGGPAKRALIIEQVDQNQGKYQNLMNLSINQSTAIDRGTAGTETITRLENRQVGGKKALVFHSDHQAYPDFLFIPLNNSLLQISYEKSEFPDYPIDYPYIFEQVLQSIQFLPQ